MAGQGARGRRHRRDPLLQQGWLNAVLAAAAALGWALYLRERRWRRQEQPQVQQVHGSPVKGEADVLSGAALGPQPSGADESQESPVDPQQHIGTSSMALQDSQAPEELQPSTSLEKEEAQLRGLALELESLAAQLNQDVLLSARSARSARAAASPAMRQPEEQSSGSPAMSAFQRRLSPLLLRPLSARSNLSSAATTPLAAGSPDCMPSAAATTPGQLGGQWSPKPTVARLAGLQLRPGSSSSGSEAASPASVAPTPASLGRMLRQGGGLVEEQLSRGLACYQEQQQQQQQQQQVAVAAPVAGCMNGGMGSARSAISRNDSSMQQAEEHKGSAPQRPSSAPVRRKQLAQRPPTPTAMGASPGDFLIPAVKGSSGTPHSHGPSPSGGSRIPRRQGGKSSFSAAGTPRAAAATKAT